MAGSTWVEDSPGLFINDTDMLLAEEDGQPVVTFEDLEQEGLIVKLALLDLFDNPFFKVPILDENGKLTSDVMPTITLGETFFANSDAEMLSLQASKGSICIRQDIAGGASYRLMGTNPSIMSHWVELRARFIFWNDIRNKPLVFKPDIHEHDERYPLIGSNGKISSSVIPSLNFLGTRYVRSSLGGMLSLPASIGSVCVRTDENKMYICFGLPNLIDSWVYVPAPDAKVESIIMKGEDHIGYVEITPESIGASPEDHEHPFSNTLIEIADEKELQFSFDEINERLSFFINQTHIADFSKEGHEHDFILEQNGQKIKVIREEVSGIPTLFWLDPLNGDTPTPFA